MVWLLESIVPLCLAAAGLLSSLGLWLLLGHRRGRIRRAGAALAVGLVVPAAALSLDRLALASRHQEPSAPLPEHLAALGALYNPHAAAPAVGAEAPDFILPEAGTGRMVSLAEAHRGRPMVLAFGSWG